MILLKRLGPIVRNSLLLDHRGLFLGLLFLIVIISHVDDLVVQPESTTSSICSEA
jgi:hypothetical protein